MSHANLGWLFYKDYFHGFNWRNLDKDIIIKKIDKLLKEKIEVLQEEPLGNMHFKATTTYPGLIVGSGYLHELPSIEEQAILGLEFDYTTGLPIIRGSSIKGVLRNAFKYPEYIAKILDKDVDDILALEIEIFGQDTKDKETIPGKDIFFDAVIINHNGKILEDDYLCPHGDDLLKNPKPLRFIKIAPNVTFMFDFELKDGIITKEQKINLFKQIIEDLGIGAKTNIGYGKFRDLAVYKTEKEKEIEKKEKEEKEFEEAIKSNDVEKLENYKKNYPESDKLPEIEKAIEQAKQLERYEEIRIKFENLDKNNRKHIENFIQKYKDEPLAEKFIKLLENLLNGKNTKKVKIDIGDINNIKDAKQLKKILEKLNEDTVKTHLNKIEEKILEIYPKQNKKKQKSFFKDAQLARFLGKDIEENIKKKINEIK